ncbi:DUF485 domain-containing protein [Streptomyces kanamyceticus]|uniref:DUF485 domain-containing protein n=1 Tax=Streptomyces kanamyceticus TaxID=1967 RepID=A0A5J6GHH9_STRKN|nr:DUF485 domain-containing protein [Streptomyces kanamyceticus]QEU93862.1 DUF485 domain-containing protein [Streptomyces kanamyceticus]
MSHPPHEPLPSYEPRPPHEQLPPYEPHLTYPWRPRPQPPRAPRPEHRLPRQPAPGRHSDLRILRGAYRGQRRVATLTALGYFTLFLALSAFAPALMTGTVTTGLSTGLLLGLCQLPVTGLAVLLYEYTARRRLDPLAERLRGQAASAYGTTAAGGRP